MSIFGTSSRQSSSKTKAVKPHKVSLWGTRLQMDPSTNVARAREIAPFGEAAGRTATGLATSLGQGASPLLPTLEAQAAGDLALGGQLNEDELRAATQGARAGYAARGTLSSGQSMLSEVLGRATYANARKRERQGFATGVAGLRQDQQRIDTGILGQTAGAAAGGYGLAEGVRQFELERADSLMHNDKRAAVDLKIGKDNAAAAKSAGKKSLLGSALGAVSTVAAAFA